jgi:hypothetical protein
MNRSASVSLPVTAWAAGMTATWAPGSEARSPSAIASAMIRVLSNMLSYTTTALIGNHLMTNVCPAAPAGQGRWSRGEPPSRLAAKDWMPGCPPGAGGRPGSILTNGSGITHAGFHEPSAQDARRRIITFFDARLKT